MARWLPAALLVALAAPAAALGDSGVGPVDPAGAGAKGIADLYWFMLAFAALVFFVVAIPLAVFIVRFRSRDRDRTVEGPQIHGSTRLELAWTAAPVLILLAIGIFTFYELGGINSPAGAAERGTIRVEARQFYWQFAYPNGVVSVSTLRLPVSRVSKLEITAPAGDVVHSFWVPNLDGKRDAIPGDPTTLKLRPDRIGVYPIRCGEFCGLQHAQMHGEVEVVSEAEYRSWLDVQAAAQTEGSSDLGAQIFSGACATCHGDKGQGFIGPALVGNPVTAQAATVETIVRHGLRTGGGLDMPAVGDGWSAVEVKALTTYLAKRFAGGSGGGQG